MWIFTTLLKKIEDLRATHNHPNFDFDHINKLMANASKLYVEAGNETPETIKNQNKELASWLELAANKEIFSRHVNTCDEARAIAASIHPAWHNCSDYAKGCHGRNIYQVLGRDLKTQVSFVICWTPEGKEIGGTRTAIVLAKRNKIPVYNLAVYEISSVEEFVRKVIE